MRLIPSANFIEYLLNAWYVPDLEFRVPGSAEPGLSCTICQFLANWFCLRRWTSLMVQTVKNLPATQETWVQSLGWKILWRRKWLPTQYSCLENPMDRGAWQATVYGIAKSQTQMSNFHLLTLDAASFPWGDNPKSIWFRPPRPSSFKGMKTASPHENAEGPVGLGKEEQETCSGNTPINSFSRCG